MMSDTTLNEGKNVTKYIINQSLPNFVFDGSKICPI